ncbi:MAG: hypothetical protein GY774_25830 [Planctomycetes bacterium]|nr:hypothetical protein [Planctomycetota bacterium]
MKNKKHYIIVTVLPLIFLFSTVIFKIRENAVLQLIFFIAILMYLALLITDISWLIKRWKSEKWLSLYPIVLWIIILLATPFITVFCVKKTFEYNLPKFQGIVEELKKEPHETGERKRSDKNVGRHVDSWYEDEVFIVQIWWGNGFPVKHTCYVYVSSGDIDKIEYFTKNFYGRLRLNQNWFRVFD